MSGERFRFDPDVAWPVLIVGTVILVSGSSDVASPDVGVSLDKLAHFAVFGVLATSVARLRTFVAGCWRGALGAWVLVACFGAFDEWRQSFTPGRSVEFGDWLADAAGAGVATALYSWDRYRALLETRIPLRPRGFGSRISEDE